jgi:hypothetical protein
MRFLISFLALITILEAKLDPKPFYGSTQRIGRDTTLKYCERKLFSDIYGIAMVKPRGTNSTLLVASDPNWCRLIYTSFNESAQELKYLRQFGGYGNAVGKFIYPMGICIDTTVYQGNTNQYAIYVTDSWNKRVAKEKYKIDKDSIVSDGILVSGLSNPTDVACVSRPEGGAYIVVAEKDTHQIRLYQRSATGVISLIQTYGTRGCGAGEFFEPQGVAICQATDAQGGYFIYVTDTGNRRVVCLRYKPSQGITWNSAYQTMENAQFLSVTASQYYCVYVTDFTQNKIWVFTPGLGELLYTYGDGNLLNGPKDICIDWDRIGLTERWTATTGIQYFKIIPEIREFYPEPNIFDATEDSVKINFRVDETANYLTMEVAGNNLFENQYFVPGRYSLYWDGRDTLGKVVLPGNYVIRIYCQGQVIATSNVTVKGTLKSGTLAQNEHWTEEGEPYVLTGDVEMPNQPNSKLVIEPGVKVMPTGNYGITHPIYWTGGFNNLGKR